MNYANIKYNDIANGDGIAVSLFVSGCPHKCKGCFNPETWDFGYGEPYGIMRTTNRIEKALKENGIHRRLNILGGEPLCPENLIDVAYLMSYIKTGYPDTPIYVWTGYTKEQLEDKGILDLLKKIGVDLFIDGKFIEEQKSYDLPMRGSSNQRIWALENGKYIDKTSEYDTAEDEK